MNSAQFTAVRGLALCLKGWDRVYHRYHQLAPVGPMLYVGLERYTGRARQFPDATVLAPGDQIGVLHFNNSRIASLGRSHSKHLTAWQFTRLLRESLAALADFSTSSQAATVAVYHGKTWMRTHGLKVGFITEPLEEGWRAQLLRLHFRVLKTCFAPAGFTDTSGILVPRNYWITRRQLQVSFGKALE